MCRLTSLSVHCLCMAVSLAVMACVLFGLGTACLSLTDNGPCPHELVVTVISVAGVFLALAVTFAVIFVRYRHSLVKGEGKSTESAALTTKPNDISSWEMTQSLGVPEDRETTHANKGSSAVTYWIEQQVDASRNDVFTTDDDTDCENQQDEPELADEGNEATETKM